MAKTKEYIIPIAPIAWKRMGLKGKQVYDRQNHEKLSYGIYLVQQHKDLPRFVNPLHVDVTFYMPYPGLIRNRHKTIWHRERPDIDNLQKLLFDSITQTDIIWKDDSLIASLISKKVYDLNPRTHLIITEME